MGVLRANTVESNPEENITDPSDDFLARSTVTIRSQNANNSNTNQMNENETIAVYDPVERRQEFESRNVMSASSLQQESLPVEYSIETIQLGSVYDVLDSKGRWCEGEIIKIDKRSARVYVSYVYWESEYDEWIDNISHRIAPKHFHTYIEGGRLKIGQRIEALDERGEWLQAFVIEEEAEKVKIHFKGYASKFDRWIRRDEAAGNVRPFGRMRFHLRYLQESRRRDFLNNSNTKWSVPGIPRNANATSSSSASSSALAAAAAYDEDKRHYSSHTTGRIICLENDERTRKITDTSDKFQQYLLALERQALRIMRVSGDGNCLFRSVAHQIYGDESLHYIIRAKCMDYMEAEKEFFAQFVVGGEETFHLYIDAKRQDGCWGDDPEIEAICELYDRPAEIWAYDAHIGAKKLRTFHEVAGGLLRHSSYTDFSTLVSQGNNVHRNQRSSNQDEEELKDNYDENSGYDRVNMDIVLDPSDDSLPVITRAHSNHHTTNSSSNYVGYTVPVIRLSYYGGGHYDSIVAEDHVVNLLRSKPGDYEEARIRQCRRLHAEQRRSQQLLVSSAPSSVSEHNNSNSNNSYAQRNFVANNNAAIASLMTPSSLALSQRHRSQQEQQEILLQAKAEEETILRLSQETARQREEADLETTLLLSLQEQQVKEEQLLRHEEEAMLSLVVAESKREYHQQFASSTGSVKQSKDDTDGSDSKGGILHTHVPVDEDDEDALLALAIAQSKEPLASHYPSDKPSYSYKQEKETDTSARSAVGGGVLSEEEALRLAIAQSLQSSHNNNNNSSSSNHNNSSSSAASSYNALIEDEEALLQQALAASLEQSHHTHENSNHSNNNFYFTAEEDEFNDPDLLLAIQESLRK